MATTKEQPLDPLVMRKSTGLTQTQFWGRIRVTQSGGSRYESGRKLPRTVRLLLEIAYGTRRRADRIVSDLRAEVKSDGFGQ